MPLDYLLDCDIKLCTDIEHDSLYQWCIREFDEHGDQVGRDQIPWSWSLRFGITNLRYAYLASYDDGHIPGLDTDWEAKSSRDKQISIKAQELIYADLKPVDGSSGSFYATSYSMFGTNRTIESFSLRLFPSEEEFCSVYGGVSHTIEIDFHDQTEEDLIQIEIGISPDKFERVCTLIEMRSVTEGYLNLERVAGFYSEWSPSASTSRIKVLAGAKDQKLEVPDGCEIEPPEAGPVGSFHIEFSRSDKLKSKGDELDESVPDETELLEQLNSKDDAQTKILMTSVIDLRRAIKRATIPLWVMSILLLLILLS